MVQKETEIMKKKKTKTLALLCAVLAVLLAAYAAVTVYNNRPSGTENETDTQEEKAQVLALEGTVTEMVVESADGTLEFILENEVWSEKSHPGFEMRQTALGSMADVFGNLPATHTIEEKTENLAEYGLDAPQYVLTARTAEGAEAVLYIGMQNTITTEYYVYAEGVPGVYTVGTTSVSYFKRNLMDFAVLPSFPSVSEGDFYSLETRNGEERLKAEVLTESAYDMSGILSWYVTEPFTHEYVAHTTTLDAILAKIAELTYSKAASYGADGAELARMGLDKPKKELAFTYAGEDAGTKSFRLLIGNADETGSYYYVQEEGSELALMINKESLDQILAYTSKDIVNKYFALISIDTVNTVEVAMDQKQYILTTPEDGAEDAAANAVREVYQSIISIHAERIIDSQTGPFTMLPLTLTFRRNTEPELYQIQFAEYDTSYYLAIVDGEGIYLINRRDYSQYCEDVGAGFQKIQ